MSIATRWYSPEPIRVAVWDGSPESLADLCGLTGQDLADRDGVVTVTLSGGKTQELRHGWGVYVDASGLGVRDPERLAELLSQDPRAAA